MNTIFWYPLFDHDFLELNNNSSIDLKMSRWPNKSLEEEKKYFLLLTVDVNPNPTNVCVPCVGEWVALFVSVAFHLQTSINFHFYSFSLVQFA